MAMQEARGVAEQRIEIGRVVGVLEAGAVSVPFDLRRVFDVVTTTGEPPRPDAAGWDGEIGPVVITALDIVCDAPIDRLIEVVVDAFGQDADPLLYTPIRARFTPEDVIRRRSVVGLRHNPTLRGAVSIAGRVQLVDGIPNDVAMPFEVVVLISTRPAGLQSLRAAAGTWAYHVRAPDGCKVCARAVVAHMQGDRSVMVPADLCPEGRELWTKQVERMRLEERHTFDNPDRSVYASPAERFARAFDAARRDDQAKGRLQPPAASRIWPDRGNDALERIANSLELIAAGKTGARAWLRPGEFTVPMSWHTFVGRDPLWLVHPGRPMQDPEDGERLPLPRVQFVCPAGCSTRAGSFDAVAVASTGARWIVGVLVDTVWSENGYDARPSSILGTVRLTSPLLRVRGGVEIAVMPADGSRASASELIRLPEPVPVMGESPEVRIRGEVFQTIDNVCQINGYISIALVLA